MSISFRMNIFVALIIPRSVRTFCAFNFVPRIIYATTCIYVYVCIYIYFFLPHYIYLAPQGFFFESNLRVSTYSVNLLNER